MTRLDILADAPALSTHRQAEWSVTLLTRTGQEIAPMEGVTGGSVEVSGTTRLRGSGTLEVVDTGQDVDWLSDRVRVTYQIVGGPTWDLGVFMMAAPQEKHTATGAARSVELTGILGVLDADLTPVSFHVAKGSVVSRVVAGIIVDAGERAAVTPSSATASADLLWDAGTPWLTVCNDLLDSINYFSLSADEAGVVVAAPYTRPQDRAVAWRFTEGALAVHTPTWDRSQDLGSIPNRVVLTSQAGGGEVPLTATASNDDPASPWGYQARGRWITHAETGVEAADQATLDGLAQRKLVSLSSPSATISASCLPLPLRPLDLVEWVTGGHTARGVIQSVKCGLGATDLMSVEILEVTS